MSCTLVEPPGVMRIIGCTCSEAPALELCGCTSTCHEPLPFPASETVISIGLLWAPAVTVRSPNESDCGSVKILGSVADGSHASPAPSTSTGASVVRLVSAKAVPAVDINADLTCFGVQLGWSWTRSAAAPAMRGVAMLVPSKTANGDPANSGSVEESTCAPTAEMSGFSRRSKAVRPAEEKLVGTPARFVSISRTSGSTSIRRGAAASGHCRHQQHERE